MSDLIFYDCGEHSAGRQTSQCPYCRIEELEEINSVSAQSYEAAVKRLVVLEATIKKVEAVGFEVHDSWGVSEEFNSGWIACRAQVELALLGEAK